jgi:hypothetical protein
VVIARIENMMAALEPVVIEPRARLELTGSNLAM